MEYNRTLSGSLRLSVGNFTKRKFHSSLHFGILIRFSQVGPTTSVCVTRSPSCACFSIVAFMRHFVFCLQLLAMVSHICSHSFVCYDSITYFINMLLHSFRPLGRCDNYYLSKWNHIASCFVQFITCSLMLWARTVPPIFRLCIGQSQSANVPGRWSVVTKVSLHGGIFVLCR